jgi:hypothetical protein
MDIAKLAKDLRLTKDDREKVLKFVIEIALSQQNPEPEWLPIADVLLKFKGKEVGAKGISSDVLYSRLKSGDFQYGVHYMNAIDSIKGETGFYLWNYKAIIESWKVPPEERRSPTVGKPSKTKPERPAKTNRILKIAS